jgi:HAD superfamily hydrolase (TIGR01549 family)
MMTDLGLPAHLREELIETYREVAPDDFEPYADVRTVLSRLRSEGMKIGILTDNPVTSQRQKLRALRLHECVDAVVFSREHGSDKPATSAFHAISKTLGTEPSRVCMVGDDLFRDVAGALQAGFGYAFLVQRPGTFANYAPALARELIGEEFEKMRFSGICGLREVVHTLDFARTRR